MEYDRADALNQAIRLLTLRHRARATVLLGTLGIYPGQDAVLLELDRNGPMIQAQIADAIGCEPPSVTLMARKLIAAGYVQKRASPTDRRASILDLTDAGRDLAGRLKALWQALAEETTAGLDDAHVDRLSRSLLQLAENLRPMPLDGDAEPGA